MHATRLCAETHTCTLVVVTLSGVISRQVQDIQAKHGWQQQTEGNPQHLKTMQHLADCLSDEEGLVYFGCVSQCLLDMSYRHICIRNKIQRCRVVVVRQKMHASF